MNAAELGLVLMSSLLTFAAGFAVPFKKKGILVRLSFWLVLFLLELCVLLIQRAGVTGKFAATAFELLTLFVLIGVYCKGIIWKNFIVYFVTTQFSNIVMAVETILFPDMGTVYSAMVVRGGHIDPVAYIVLVAVNVVAAWLNALLVRRILKPEILSGANVYRVMTLIIMTSIVLMGSLGHEFVDEMKTEHGGDSLFLLGFWIGFTIIWILVFNVIALIYNRAEKHRIRSRKALIEKLANDNYSHYRTLAQTNDELRVLYDRTDRFRHMMGGGQSDEGRSHAGGAGDIMEAVPAGRKDDDRIYAQLMENADAGVRNRYEFSLSGCLAVDSLLYEYSEKSKNSGISFSAVMEPLDDMNVTEPDAAAIVEYLLEDAFAGMKRQKRREQDSSLKKAWIMLDVRVLNGMMLFVISSNVGQGNLKGRFYDRFCEKIQERFYEEAQMDILTDIAAGYHGVVQRINTDGEKQVRLFIPG